MAEDITKLTDTEREYLIEQSLETQEGRQALAASMANPIRINEKLVRHTSDGMSKGYYIGESLGKRENTEGTFRDYREDSVETTRGPSPDGEEDIVRSLRRLKETNRNGSSFPLKGKVTNCTLDYQAVGRKCLVVDPLPDGALPVYDRDIRIPSTVIGKRGQAPDTIVEGERITVPTFENVSYPQVRFSQAKARRFNLIDRAQQRAKIDLMAIEDENIFAAIQAASITQNPLTTVATTLSKAAMISAMTEIGKQKFAPHVSNDMSGRIHNGETLNKNEIIIDDSENTVERLTMKKSKSVETKRCAPLVGEVIVRACGRSQEIGRNVLSTDYIGSNKTEVGLDSAGMGSTIKSGYISEHLDDNQDNAEERLEEIQESATTNTPDISIDEMKIESEPYGDIRSTAEMTVPLSNDNCNKSLIPAKFISNMVNYKLDQIGEHPCNKNEKSIDDYNLYCMDNTEERPYISNA